MARYYAILERQSDGHVFAGYTDLDTEDDGLAIYMWTEGNYSCDCNRAIFAGDDDNAECGEARYRLVLLINEDGETVASEPRRESA